MKDMIGSAMEVAVGGAVMRTVGDSSMPQGFKDATQIGIGTAVLGSTIKKTKKWL